MSAMLSSDDSSAPCCANKVAFEITRNNWLLCSACLSGPVMSAPSLPPSISVCAPAPLCASWIWTSGVLVDVGAPKKPSRPCRVVARETIGVVVAAPMAAGAATVRPDWARMRRAWLITLISKRACNACAAAAAAWPALPSPASATIGIAAALPESKGPAIISLRSRKFGSLTGGFAAGS